MPEILQNAQLAYIKREDSAALNHRSTSEPNLSEVITDSSVGSSEDVNVSNGFPRACSLDSHLDEPVVNNTDGAPTVTERDIQMSEAIQELRKSDGSIAESVDENKSDNDANDKDGVKANTSGETNIEMEASTNHKSNIVAVELHSQACPSETIVIAKPDKPLPPIPPPRKRKQGSLSIQSSVSSTATSVQTTPKQVSPVNESSPSPKETFNLVSSDMTIEQTTDKSTGSNRQEWKKQMLRQHLPPDYVPTESEHDDNTTLNNDLNASVDLDEIIIDGILPNGITKDESIMSESLLVQSTHSVEERHDMISNPSCDSPVLSRRPKHPLVMAARISSISSCVSSGVAYEEQDIDSILDKLSLASTFTDKDDTKINTWEKIQIVEQPPSEPPHESGKENSSVQPVIQKEKEKPENFVNTPNKNQKVNFKRIGGVAQGNNKKVKENNAAGISKKFKMKHRQKLDKAQKRKAKINHIHRGKEVRSKGTAPIDKKKANTNSLDRDALRIGEYFSAMDVCDFDFSRSISIEDSKASKNNTDDTTAIESPQDSITLQQYKYADDDIWIPMTQSTESEPGMRKVDINSPIKNVQILQDGKQVIMKSSLPRQDAMESLASNSFTDSEPDKSENNPPWVRRTQSEDTSTTRTTYPKIARIYHSQESDIL